MKKLVFAFFIFFIWSVALQAQPTLFVYGLASQGGAANQGTIFSINETTGVFKKIQDFYGTGDGPKGSLIFASNGLLYGVTWRGGASNQGTIFSFDTATNTLTKVYDFTGTDGNGPKASLYRASNGLLYGTTFTGGAFGYGTLFSFNPVTKVYTKIHDFTGDDGGAPENSLVQVPNGLLYGVTVSGGTNNTGFLFSVNPSTNSFTNLVEFNGGSVGIIPRSNLLLASNGLLYGVTQAGGASGQGTIFSFDPATNTLTKVHDFTGTDGANPFDNALLQTSGGLLYGMTRLGGANNNGVIYSLDPATNTYTKKYDFTTSDGARPIGNLFQASNGLLYGMTNLGGINNSGTAFSFNSATNIFTKLSDFETTGGTSAPENAAFVEVSRVVSPPPSTAPVITSFAPTTGAAGTQVIITGNNFDPNLANDIVYFGAVKATVTAATSTSLTVIVPAGATYQPISVTANALTGYSTLPFTVTFPCNGSMPLSSSFVHNVKFPAGPNSQQLALGDIDGDGKADLVTGNANGTNTISVLRNTTTGSTLSFAPQVDKTAPKPANVVLADLNSDGKLDFIAGLQTINSGGGVSVITNISTPGTIAFATSTNVWASNVFADEVAVGDLDGDGKPEVAYVGQSSNTVEIRKNGSTGDGQIDLSSFTRLFASANLNDIAIGDVDGDGKPDLVVSTTANTISVFRNISSDGVISFAPKVDFPTKGGPRGLTFGDLDGDGKLDLVVANSTLNTVLVNGENAPSDNYLSVFKNSSSSGTIALTRQDFLTQTAPYAVAIGDLNGDGKPDVATTNISSFNPENVVVFTNTSNSGNLSFAAPALITNPGEGAGPSLAIGDLDGDGKPDIAVASYSNSVQVLKNQLDCSGQVLPLQLTNFSAQLKGNDGALNWQTANEENTAHFEIERSTDNRSYVNVGNVTAAGQSTSPLTYNYTDKNIAALGAPVVYYRLKMVDNDGHFTYSKTVPVNISSQAAVVTIYPNPNLGRFQVQLTGFGSQKLQVQILDARGSVVQTKTVNVQESSLLDINLQGRTKGLYFVRVVSDKGTQIQKVQVQ